MMGNAPERIFAWVYEEGSRRHHVWRGKVGPGGDGQTEYVRADLARAPSWQPIETAPKDGVKFLAYWPSDSFRSSAVQTLEWVGRNLVYTRDRYPVQTWPTHWMHRPAPPEAS